MARHAENRYFGRFRGHLTCECRIQLCMLEADVWICVSPFFFPLHQGCSELILDSPLIQNARATDQVSQVKAACVQQTSCLRSSRRLPTAWRNRCATLRPFHAIKHGPTTAIFRNLGALQPSFRQPRLVQQPTPKHKAPQSNSGPLLPAPKVSLTMGSASNRKGLGMGTAICT